MASRRKRGSEHGQDLVEFALITPLLMLILLGIIEFSLVVFCYNSLSNAAREGARYGTVHPADTVGIRAATLGSLIGVPATADNVKVVCTPLDCTKATQVRVQVEYDYDMITAPMQRVVGVSGTIHLAAASTMNTEN